MKIEPLPIVCGVHPKRRQAAAVQSLAALSITALASSTPANSTISKQRSLGGAAGGWWYVGRDAGDAAVAAEGAEEGEAGVTEIGGLGRGSRGRDHLCKAIGFSGELGFEDENEVGVGGGIAPEDFVVIVGFDGDGGGGFALGEFVSGLAEPPLEFFLGGGAGPSGFDGLAASEFEG
jgi:hypothetical protein